MNSIYNTLLHGSPADAANALACHHATDPASYTALLRAALVNALHRIDLLEQESRARYALPIRGPSVAG